MTCACKNQRIIWGRTALPLGQSGLSESSSSLVHNVCAGIIDKGHYIMLCCHVCSPATERSWISCQRTQPSHLQSCRGGQRDLRPSSESCQTPLAISRINIFQFIRGDIVDPYTCMMTLRISMGFTATKMLFRTGIR